MSAATVSLTFKRPQVMSGILLFWSVSAATVSLTIKRPQVVSGILLFWSVSAATASLTFDMFASCICCSVNKMARWVDGPV